MDTMNSLEQNARVLEVTENGKQYLKTTSSWTTFMAVLNFIGVCFMVLCGIVVLLTGAFFNDVNYGSVQYPDGIFTFLGLFYVIIGVILIFPSLFLLRFSQKTSKALQNQDPITMEEAFKNMKAYWKFNGILVIVTIALCIILIPIMVMVGASAASATMPMMY